MTTIATILYAGAHIQGDLIERHSVRNFQTGEAEFTGRATVDVFGKRFTGQLVPSIRNRP